MKTGSEVTLESQEHICYENSTTEFLNTCEQTLLLQFLQKLPTMSVCEDDLTVHTDLILKR